MPKQRSGLNATGTIQVDRLLSLVDAARKRHRRSWRREGHTVVVQLGKTGRIQTVLLEVADEEYVFTSVVLGTKAVTKRRKRWDELALLAWRRNADQQLVTFAFDAKDRLVGQIRHPKDTLDREELELYINSLAWDCDRFEYLLSGADMH